MNIRILAASLALAGMSVSADTTSTANWNFSKNQDATTPGAAADWFAGMNWDVDPSVPDGKDWKAIISGGTRRYISIGQALTLGRFTATKAASADSPVILSDFGITVDNASSSYVICGGRFYADLLFPSGRDQGVSGGSSDSTEFAGRISSGRQLVLAGGVLRHRLDLFATSSDPVRAADFALAGINRGTGHMVTVGPRKGSAFSDTWIVTAGSPFVSRSVSTPRVASGAVVTCAGVFPAGTFVKRIFDENLIELSAAAAYGSTGEQTLEFAAIDPETTIEIENLRMNSTVSGGGNFVTGYLMPDADGKFRIEVKNLVAGNKTGEVGTDAYYRPFTPFADATKVGDGATYYPAMVVIHDAALAESGDHANAAALKLLLCDSHLEFAETGRVGARSGLPDSAAASYSAASITRITVTNNIDAAIGNVLSLTSTIVKDGAGSLELTLTNNAAANSGTVVIREGTVVLTPGSWVKTVAVSNGATLKVMGTFEPENFIFEPGASLAGPGTLVLKDLTTVSGLAYADQAGVRLKGGSGEVMNELPTLEVVGDPAFHVDASVAASLVTANDDGVHVVRWNDVRKATEDDAYLFATNVVNTPEIVKNSDGTVSHVYFQRYNTAPGAKDLTTQYDLVWSQVITNMRVIFQVLDCSNGGGQFLGMTPRLKAVTGRANDFVRDGGTTYAGDVFYRNNSGTYQKAVIAGDLHVNGFPRNSANGYLYQGGKTSRGSSDYVYSPQVADVSPTLPVAADCFTTDSDNQYRSGDKRLCELIVYTNELTVAEKVAVRGYLMKKWMNCDVDCAEPTGPAFGALNYTGKSAPRFDVAAGETLVAESVMTDGSFAKGGPGVLQVNGFGNPSADLTVAGGTLRMRSVDTSAAGLPANPLFRMDASATELMLIKEHNGVPNAVRWWKSSHDQTFDWWCWGTSTNPPTIKYDQLNGLPMVDFGRATSYSGDIDSSHMFFTLQKNLKSVFMVANTSGGGNIVVGKKDSWSQGGVLRGGFVSNKTPTGNYGYAQPLATTDGGTPSASAAQGGVRARLNGVVVSPKTEGFSGGNDLLSWVSYVDTACDTYGLIQGYGRYGGGSKLGEYIAYGYGLSVADARKVEAYLNKKWFNRTTPNCCPAAVNNLTIAAGATLILDGGAPLTVNGTISGGGSVEGDVKAMAATRIDLTIADDGTLLGGLAVSGTLDLGTGGSVRVEGPIKKLKAGHYTIATATSLIADAGAWTVESPVSTHLYDVVKRGNSLLLVVSKPGMLILVR